MGNLHEVENNSNLELQILHFYQNNNYEKFLRFLAASSGSAYRNFRNPMNRIVFLLIALMLLIPLFYVIFFTPFIPLLLRQLRIGRSTDDVKILVDDAEQAITNRVRDLEAQRNAADEELNDVGPIKIVRRSTKPDPEPESDQTPETIIPDEVMKAPKKKKSTQTNTPTE
ncbi:MAG: hypothetical protein V4727_13130 [Verrucomicrobiota bacterium]